MKASSVDTSINLANKSIRPIDESTKTILDSKLSQLADRKILKTSWLFSSFVFAFFVFIFLNAIFWSIRFFVNPGTSSDIAAIKLNNLRQLVIDSPYEAERCGPWPWWVARAYFKTKNPNIVTMGDSQINAALIQADAMTMDTHLDCTVDRSCIALRKELQGHGLKKDKSNISAVNLALGGAMPSDYYVMSKAFFTKKYHPKLVIIGLSPRCFLDATLPCASATETFQFLAPTADMGNLINYAFTNPVEKYFWIIRNNFTLYTYQQDILLALHSAMTKYFGTGKTNANIDLVPGRQPLPSIYSGSGFIVQGTNMVGPNARIPFRENKREYETRFAQLNINTFAAQTAYFKATLEYLKTLGVQVIVVDMPMLQTVRDLLPKTFWNTYRFGLKSSCREHNAYLLDLVDSKEFPQDEFIDYVHLNATGGKHLVDKLAVYIENNCNFK